MIRSFRCKDTEAIASGLGSAKFGAIERQAQKRLRWLSAATNLQDLANVRGNRLKALAAERRGQHSIRVNDQWRICFQWKDGAAWEVEIVDYH